MIGLTDDVTIRYLVSSVVRQYTGPCACNSVVFCYHPEHIFSYNQGVGSEHLQSRVERVRKCAIDYIKGITILHKAKGSFHSTQSLLCWLPSFDVINPSLTSICRSVPACCRAMSGEANTPGKEYEAMTRLGTSFKEMYLEKIGMEMN